MYEIKKQGVPKYTQNLLSYRMDFWFYVSISANGVFYF